MSRGGFFYINLYDGESVTPLLLIVTQLLYGPGCL